MMIPDENETPDAIISSPSAAPDVSSRDGIIKYVMSQSGAENHATRAANMAEALVEADRLATDAMASIMSSMHRALTDSDRGISLSVNTFMGHADRLNSEALDSASRFLNRAGDNLQRELSLAEDAIDRTPARPVRTPDETAYILSVSAADAAEVMIMDRAGMIPDDGGMPTVDVPASSSSPGITRPPLSPPMSIANVVQQAILAASMPTATTPAPAGPTLCTEPNWAAAGITPYNPIDWPFGVPTYTLDRFYKYIQYIYDTGGRSTYSGPRGLDHTYIGYQGFPTAEVTTTTADGVSHDHAFSLAVDEAYNVGTPFHQQLTKYIPNFPPGSRPYQTGTINCSGGGILISDNPSTVPPPPIQPPSTDCPVSTGPACCPAEPMQEASYKSTLPTPTSTRSWNHEVDFCRVLSSTAILGGIGEPPATIDPAGEVPGVGSLATDIAGWAEGLLDIPDPAPTNPKPTIPRAFSFFRSPVAGSPSQSLIDSFAVGQALTVESSKGVSQDDAAIGNRVVELSATLAAAGWAHTVTGAPTDYLSHQSLLKLRYFSPQYIPDQSSLDEMYLRNKISQENWECLTRANGNLVAIHEASRDCKAFINNIDDIIDLYLREEIDIGEMFNQCRSRGVLDRGEITNRIVLRMQIPTMPDLIRFMVKDVENEQVVADGNLMEGFTENYKGDVKKWAEYQSIPEKVFRFQWASHWELPSPTQANEMLRRLRKGRVPDALAVDADQIKRLYASADYAPGWRDRMMAVSYLTPTRSEARMGYETGAYDRDELIEMLQDTGLTLDGAKTVAKLYDKTKAQRRQQLLKRNTLWSVSRILSQFRDGIISPNETTDLLKMLGFDEQQIQESISSTVLMRETITRSKCLKGIRRRYFVGAIDDKDAINGVTKLTDDLISAREMISQWGCERASSLQEVPARKNVEWAIRGIITLDELKTRLIRLRYNTDDITRFEAEVVDKVREAQAKAIKAALKEQLAEARARLAEYRRLIAEREKYLKELEKANQPPKSNK